MLYELVGKPDPPFSGNDFHQVHFDFFGVLLRRQTQSPSHPPNMGVHDDPRDPESVSEYDIGRLAPDARKLDQCLQVPGYVPSVLVKKDLAARLDIPGDRKSTV